MTTAPAKVPSTDIMLPSQDIQLEEVFNIVDSNKSGTIDIDELFQMVRLVKTGTTREEVVKIFLAMDESKNRTVEKKEFISHFKNLFKGDTQREFYERMLVTKKYLQRKPALGAVFEKFDADKSGSLEKGEIFRMVRQSRASFTNEELNALLKKIDTSGDGKVQKDEFITYYFHVFAADSDKDFEARLEAAFLGRRKVKLQSLFNMYDLNNDGILDLGEFGAFVKKLKEDGRTFTSSDDVLDLLIKIDSNKDRKVDFEEWSKFLTGLFAFFDDSYFNKALKNLVPGSSPSEESKSSK